MRLPDFLICGAQKSGTTTLIANLSLHPNIYIPKHGVKPYGRELHFFDIDKRFQQGIEWYSHLFNHCDDNNICGEKTPSYMNQPKVAHRIRFFIPNVKLIFILRNPVDRAYSEYWMLRRKNTEHRSFLDAVFADDTKMLWKGQYIIHLERFRQLFDSSQIHVTTLHKLKVSPNSVYRNICRFLGASPEDMPLCYREKHNVGGEMRSDLLASVHAQLRYKMKWTKLAEIIKFLNIKGHLVAYLLDEKRPSYPPMTIDVYRQLTDFFRPYNHKLMEMYPELDINHWMKTRNNGERHE